jgi:pimeloyl-ACP methyl ester carboxylesterase
MSRATASANPTLHLPRLLCLHGGGVNGEVFQLQARALIAALQNTFRLVFADGPFLCNPGPGIVPVYADFGPFRRWLRWLPEHPEIDSASAIDEIWFNINDAMDADDRAGATGEWVGLAGFSQGGKLSACLLYEQQVREQSEGRDEKRPHWRFAILLAARAPLVSLRPETDSNKALVTPAEISEGFESVDVDDDSHMIKLPTVHVHGLQDPGLHLHQRLLNQYCDPAATTLVEWDGTHRVPIKKADVAKVTEAIFDVAKRTGVLK